MKFPVDASVPSSPVFYFRLPTFHFPEAPLTLPNHATLKASTLRTICSQSGIPRADFIEAYRNS
jgi:hypothetical protein